MEKDFEKAIRPGIAELDETVRFLLRLTELDPKQIVEEVKARDPSFIEFWLYESRGKDFHIKGGLFYWRRFAEWTIARLRQKYPGVIWLEIVKLYSYLFAQEDVEKDTYGMEMLDRVEEIMKRWKEEGIDPLKE